MQVPEPEEVDVCTSCGTELAAAERGYAFGERVLCVVCATARGGVWDDQNECWRVQPDVTDLRRASEM